MPMLEGAAVLHILLLVVHRPNHAKPAISLVYSLLALKLDF